MIEDFIKKNLIKDSNNHFRIIDLPGGVSSDIKRVLKEDGTSFVVKKALPKLKVKEDWFSNPERNFVESKAIKMVSTVFPNYVPKIIFSDPNIPIFAMEYVEGRNWKSELMKGNIDNSVANNLGFFLASFHNISYMNEGWLNEFENMTLFRELRISPYLETILDIYPTLKEKIGRIIIDLTDQKKVLVHGDFSPKNVILREDNSICILDWEVAHAGNFAFDISFMMSHLLLKAIHFGNKHKSYEALAIDFYKSYFAKIKMINEKDSRQGIFRITGALILARVDGKSPVEYLNNTEKELARKFGEDLINDKIDVIEQIDGIIGDYNGK